MIYTEDNIHLLECRHSDVGHPTIYWYDCGDGHVHWRNAPGRKSCDSSPYKPSYVINNLKQGHWIPIKQEVTETYSIF